VGGGVPAAAPAPWWRGGRWGCRGRGRRRAAQPINLNTATLEQLDTLTGVRTRRPPEKILAFREEQGAAFGSVDELARGTSGIRRQALGGGLREQVTRVRGRRDQRVERLPPPYASRRTIAL
jgi:competence protein ComEA